MNIKVKLIACGLVLASIFTVENSNAACVKSGVGVAVSFDFSKPKVKIDASKINEAKSKAEEDKKTKIKEAIKALQTKTSTKIDANTEMEDSSSTFAFNTYSQNNIQNASSSNALPTADKKELKLKKFKGDNPTRYRIFTDASNNKYDANGMVNANTGAAITNYPILVAPGVLAANNYQNLAPQQNNGSDTKVVGNYATIQDNNGTYRLTPRDAVILDEMTQALANNLPTHARLGDIKSTDPIAYNLMAKMYANDTTKKAWEAQLGADNWLYRANDSLYINTVNKPDWGLSDTLVDSSLSTLGGTSSTQTVSDVSKLAFNLSLDVFYQFRVFDWFVRVGIFGTLPLMNKEVSLLKDSNSSDSNSSSSDKSSDKKNKSSTDFSLKHKWDMGLKLVAGYNITQTFSIVAGGEVVYHKYELTNTDKFYSAYQINPTLSEILGETANATDWQKNYGYDGNKTKEFGKWSFNGVVGAEFNWNNFIMGLQLFCGPKLQLLKTTDKNSFGSLTVTNVGLRIMAGYVF